MNNAIKLPDTIVNIFKLAEKLEINSTATVRPALTNNMLLSHHPASCRALKAQPLQQPTA